MGDGGRIGRFLGFCWPRSLRLAQCDLGSVIGMMAGLGPSSDAPDPGIACFGGHSHGHSTKPYCSQRDHTQRNAIPT